MVHVVYDPASEALANIAAIDPQDFRTGPREDLGFDDIDGQEFHLYRYPVFQVSPVEFVGYVYVFVFPDAPLTLAAAAAGDGPADTDVVGALQWRDQSGTLLAQLSDISITFGELADQTSVDFETSYQYLASLFDGDNTIIGSSTDTEFEAGEGGTATVTGGSGDETLRVWHDKNIVFDGNGGSDTIEFQAYLSNLTPVPVNGAVVDLTLGTAGPNPYGTGTLTLSDIENVLGTTASDTLTGNSADNRLDGFRGGDDTLHGLAGNDTILVAIASSDPTPDLDLDGGTDTDTLIFDVGGSTSATNVLDLTNAGNNTGAFGNAAIAGFEIYEVGDLITVPSSAKSVEVRGTESAETVTGGQGDDILKGNGGNDSLAGGRGVDDLFGGEGNDTLDSKSPTINDIVLPPFVDDDLYGEGGDDTLIVRRGSAGDIDGGTGTDKAIIDRTGFNSSIILDISNSSIVQNLADGSMVIGIEQIEIVTQNGADEITGGALDDVISSGLGNDTLHGGGGNDTLDGASGLDKLFGEAGNDTLNVLLGLNPADELDGGADTDKLILDWTSFASGITLDITNPATLQTLADGTTVVNIEQLEVTAGDGADIVTGGALADRFGFSFITNAGNDIFKGAGGNDIMFGGLGNDTLNGGDDNDTLTGGAGKDSQTGGLGLDTFDFNATSETTKGAGRDILIDFKRGQDKIDLDAIDANTKIGGNQDFKFIGKQSFHKKAGELHFVKQGANVLIEGDINGNGKADFQIQVSHMKALGAGDFDL